MSGFDRPGFYKELGLTLKSYRTRAGKTQHQIAGELGDVTRATLASIETGRIRAPADICWRLSIVFGVPVMKLLPERSDTRALQSEEPKV